MGTENTSGLLPTSLLPKGPFPYRVPPKPQPRRERWHWATDTVTVLNRNTCTGEAGDHGQEKGQLTRNKSIAPLINSQGDCISSEVMTSGSSRIQSASSMTPAEEQWASIGFTPVPKPRLIVGPTPAEEQWASIGFTPVPKPHLRVGPTPAEEQWASIRFTPVPKPRLRVGPTPAEEQWASIRFTPVPKPRLRVGPTLNPHSRDSGLAAGHMEEPLCLRTNPVQRLPPPNKPLPTLKRNGIVQRMVHTNTENRNSGSMVVIDTEGSGADLHYAQLPRGSRERLNTTVTDKLNANCRERNGLLETLWQERKLVQESGILPYLNKQELLLQESMYEVVTTEQSYLERLGVAVNHFMKSSTLRLALSPRDHKSLFSSIAKIREISQNFLDVMREELESNLLCDMLCDVIHRHTSSHFGAYVDYIRNMPYQEQTMHNLGRENPQIMEILRELQDDQRCYRLPLKSFLVLPFQRITQLKILIENILKSTERGSERQVSAEKALRALIKVVEACNREVGRMKMMEEIVHIANKTEFECKALPLVSSSRWLVRQGQLAQLSEKENIFGHRKLCHIYLFLFNDLLLVTTRKGMDRFVVRDHVHRSLIEVSEGLEEKEDLVCASWERMFCLALLKNQRGTTSQFLLQASTQ
ncbi:rho guanine nucleotide exchange factor 15 [Oncorhynchus clarkii lewisi]|uniref:rho guanine nucleotide exchange factor 15 n=1 Tax=Oncorhynchus clarkii lewisi TaxID=490388 RepID=UPI0039B84969